MPPNRHTAQEAPVTAPSPFLVDLDLPVGSELRRVLVGQADRALVPLESEGPTESVVHEARKASKRARAVGHLVRPLVRRETWRALDRGFRDAARPLGPLRDADVARKTLGDAAPPRPEIEGLPDAVVAAYRLARGRADALDIDHAQPTDVLRGLEASWRGARRALADADPTDPETFHEWRKAVKRLYYQVQLLSALQPAVLGGLANQLDLLQESLGDHHDLVVAAGLTAEPGPDLDERRRALEAQTVPLGRFVFAASTKRFGSWLSATFAAR